MKAKKCVVVLERLDEKLLSQYIMKFNSSTVEKVGFVTDVKNQSKRDRIYLNDTMKTYKYSSKKKWKKSQKSEESITKNKFKRKKRKIKSLYFSDDEIPNDANCKKRFLSERKKISESSKNMKLAAHEHTVVKTNNNSDERNKSSTIKSETSICNTNTILNRKNSPDLESKCNEITLNNVRSSNCNESNNTKVTSANADIEIKLIKDITKQDIFKIKKNKNTKKLGKSTVKFVEEQFLVTNEQPLEGDEYDSREDDEDDRDTVIFEKSPYKETDSKKVSELHERKFECPATITVNKEITNCKEQELIDFKRKTLGTVKEPDIRIVEGSGKQKVSSLDYGNEDCLKQICSLVKRLHELYRIISQLRKELPKNDELSVHFLKVISVQEENFCNEIIKSKKTIIECYKKMLNLYNNSAKAVVLEISKRAFLGLEEVSNIISRCFLLDGTSGGEKNKNVFPKKQENFHKQPPTSDSLPKNICENLLRLLVRTTVHKNNHSAPRSHPYSSSGGFIHPHKFAEGPKVEPVVPWQVPVRKYSMSHTQNSLDHGARSFLPSYSHQQTLEQKKSYIRTQQKNQSQVMDPSLRQQHDLKYLRPISGQPPSPIHNIHPSNIKTHYPQSSSIKPTASSHFFMNPTGGCIQQTRFHPGLSALVEKPTHPLFVERFNNPHRLQQKSASHKFPQSNMEILSSVSPAVQNIFTCNAVRQQNIDFYSSKIHSSQVVVSNDKERCPLEGYLNDSVRFSNQTFIKQIPNGLLMSRAEMFGKYCSIDVKSRAEFENPSNWSVQEVLDPTVPQKLTMKNYRLQAGPTLGQKNEDKDLEEAGKLNSLQLFSEETEDCSGLGEEDSKSRVYICAQNGCKMPGLRVCKGCQSIIYCSETCQLKHWTLKHKTECHQLKELRGV